MGRSLNPQPAGSPVDSIQTIAKEISFNTTSNSSITAVDTAKTVVISAGGMLGSTMSANANVRGRTEANAFGIGAHLSSSTNVQFVTSNRPDSGGNTLYSTRNAYINVFVLEYA
jgi:hypothetical protein